MRNLLSICFMAFRTNCVQSTPVCADREVWIQLAALSLRRGIKRIRLPLDIRGAADV